MGFIVIIWQLTASQTRRSFLRELRQSPAGGCDWGAIDLVRAVCSTRPGRIIKGASSQLGGGGVTQVLRPAILLPATECDTRSIKRRLSLRGTAKARARSGAVTAHGAFVFTVTLGHIPPLPPGDRGRETAACSSIRTGTRTSTRILTGAALLRHVQVWQLVFPHHTRSCAMTQTGR